MVFFFFFGGGVIFPPEYISPATIMQNISYQWCILEAGISHDRVFLKGATLSAIPCLNYTLFCLAAGTKSISTIIFVAEAASLEEFLADGVAVLRTGFHSVVVNRDPRGFLEEQVPVRDGGGQALPTPGTREVGGGRSSRATRFRLRG